MEEVKNLTGYKHCNHDLQQLDFIAIVIGLHKPMKKVKNSP